MKLYTLKKRKKHTKADTDAMILASVDAFCREKQKKPYNGKILRTTLGKPYLEEDYLYIGVTHTDDLILISVSCKAHGIDCEYSHRKVNNPERIMNRFFTEDERFFITSKDDTNSAFLDVWVRKEAYVKYTGKGISGMKDCDVTKINGFTKTENDLGLIIYIYEEVNNE